MKKILVLLLSLLTFGLNAQGTKLKIKQLENPGTSSLNLGANSFSAGAQSTISTLYVPNTATVNGAFLGNSTGTIVGVFATNTISGTDNNSMILRVNATDYLKLDSARGHLGLGTKNLAGSLFRIGLQMSGSTTGHGVYVNSQIQSDVTASAFGYRAGLTTGSGSWALTNLINYSYQTPTFAGTSTVTNMIGYEASDFTTLGTNNYGIINRLTSGTNKWGYYGVGNALNYFAGRVGIGESAPNNSLVVGGSDASTTQSSSSFINIFNSSATTNNYANIAFGQSGISSNSFSRFGVQYTDRTGGSEDQSFIWGTVGGGAYSEKMRLHSTGQLSIGNTNATASLNVTGTFSVSGGSTVQLIYSKSTATTGTTAYNGFFEPTTGATNNFAIGTSGGIRQTIGTGNIQLSALPSNTNVGVLYLNQATPSDVNYSLASTNAATTYLNGVTATQISVGTNLRAYYTSYSARWEGGSYSGTGVGDICWWTTGAGTALAASTEVNSYVFNASTQQYNTGALSTLRKMWIKPDVISFVGASTLSDAYGLYVSKPTAGTNATITRNWGIGTDGNISAASYSASSTSSLNGLQLVSGGYSVTTKGIDVTAGDAATINSPIGRFRKDNSGAVFTLTNSQITANSIIVLTAANAAIDATATGWTVSAGAGSATITFNAAPSADFNMNFIIMN